MLEKNKDYIEFRLTGSSVHGHTGELYEIKLDGLTNNPHFPAYPVARILEGDDQDVVLVSERKFDQLQTENEQLKKKLEESLTTLYPEPDVEKMVWVTRHVFGCQPSNNGWMPIAMLWKRHYDNLFKLVGFSSLKEIHDYLTNEDEADTLYEAISKLRDQVKYTCDEWYSANSRNNSWKAAAECNSSKELIEKIEAFEKEIGTYSRALNEWKEGTGCPSPSAAKTLIESGASWMSAYHSSCEVIKTWKKLTGCDTPAEAKSRIEGLENAIHLTDKTLLGELEKEIDAWQKATDCDTPEKAMKHLSELRDKRTHIVYLNDPLGIIAKWERVTGYDRPEDFLKWKADIEGIMEAWKSGTGCKYPAEARILLEKWKVLTKCETPEAAATWITSYESACERGNKLAEDAAEREKEWQDATGYSCPEDFLSGNELAESAAEREKAHWQDATGRISPEAAKQYIDRLKGRLNKIHGYSVDF